MSGGLIQLVAYGIQDLYLTKDPQITFFKIVYRRHTNFSSEVIPQSFIHTPNFGRKVTCVLARDGDLIGKMHLVLVLPHIPQFKDECGNIDMITKFAWVRRIGFALIKNIEIELGNELIDKQYGDWLNIWHELTIPDNKDLSRMLGDIKELTEFTNGKKSFKLFVPLQFWFNRFPGLALPALSLQYNHIKLNLELRDFDEVSLISPTHYININNDFVNFKPFEFIQQTVGGSTALGRFSHFDIINRKLYFWKLSKDKFISLKEDDPEQVQVDIDQDILPFSQFLIKGLTSKFEVLPRINAIERLHKTKSLRSNSVNIKDAFLLVEYIFLDSEERVRFYQAKNEYLIEQIQFNGEATIDGMNQSFRLGFTQPCKELIWVSQLNCALNTKVNDLFNYSDSLLRNENDELIGNNIIREETLIFSGKERVSFRDSDYFTLIQPYQYHIHNPATGINVYSFSLHPEKHQPSGSANFSELENTRLKLTVSPDIDFINTAKLRVYARVNNILRIANGISGLVFSNDR